MRTAALNAVNSLRSVVTDTSDKAEVRGRRQAQGGRVGRPARHQSGSSKSVRLPVEDPTTLGLPVLFTVDEAADLLRTTRRAVYVMAERDQLPGLTRIGRRMLVRSCDLLHWLDGKRSQSSRE